MTTPRERFVDVDLVALREQYSGSEYRQIVQAQLRRLGSRLEAAAMQSLEGCSDEERQAGEALIDAFNAKGYDPAFWRSDCGAVLEEVSDEFAERMEALGADADDAAKLNMFQLVTLNFALAARDQREMRKFAGIKKGWLFR